MAQLVESCPLGYPRLAAFNASEQNFMLYRGFSYVHARLLLDLQTGIQVLERELDEFDNEDNTDEKQLRLQCWEEDLEAAGEAVSEMGTKQRTRRDVLDELHDQVSKYGKYVWNAKVNRSNSYPYRRASHQGPRISIVPASNRSRLPERANMVS